MLLRALGVAFGIVLAQADLPNANLPGNSATLPNSNQPGPLPTDNPIMLPNTDTSGSAVTEAQAMRAQQVQQARTEAERQEALQLLAKATEEAARARAEAAEANQALQKTLEQRQP
ncbi:MAG TPA: hypothetical protein VHB97_08525 [Polyangia bacterium]|nr:hypothetical protein [Polyangia bacterium]